MMLSINRGAVLKSTPAFDRQACRGKGFTAEGEYFRPEGKSPGPSDKIRRTVTCESGALLADILSLFCQVSVAGTFVWGCYFFIIGRNS